jgi:hypothetical protein
MPVSVAIEITPLRDLSSIGDEWEISRQLLAFTSSNLEKIPAGPSNYGLPLFHKKSSQSLTPRQTAPFRAPTKPTAINDQCALWRSACFDVRPESRRLWRRWWQ